MLHAIELIILSLLADAFHQRAAVYLFGRRIPSACRRLFVWPTHSISAPPFICLANAFHQRAAVYLFGRRIPSAPRRFFVRPAMSRAASSFVWPAHSPPTHRFGVAVRPAHLIAAPHSLSFGRRIRRRSAYLVLFRLAGTFPAKPPPIWCCSVWPAHPPPSRHRFGVVSFGRRIPRRFGLFICRRICHQPTVLVLLHLADASPRCATIACLGWHIPMPIFSPAHPLAAPPSLFWPAHSFATPPLLSAGVFICRAALLLLASTFICHVAVLAFGRRIDSPRRPLASGLCIHSPRRPCFRQAYLFAVPQSPFFAGASHRHASITYLGRRIPSPHRPIVFHFVMRGNSNGFPFPQSSKIMVHLIAAPPSPISVCDLAGAIGSTAAPR